MKAVEHCVGETSETSNIDAINKQDKSDNGHCYNESSTAESTDSYNAPDWELTSDSIPQD